MAVRRAAKATERYFIAAGGTYSPDYPACEDVALDLLADWSAPDTREKAFYARFLLGSIPRDVEFYVKPARRIRLRAVRVLSSNVGSWFSVGRNKDAALLQADHDDGNEMTTATKRRTKGALITKRDRGETLKVKNRDGNTGRYVAMPDSRPSGRLLRRAVDATATSRAVLQAGWLATSGAHRPGTSTGLLRPRQAVPRRPDGRGPEATASSEGGSWTDGVCQAGV